MAAMFGMVGGTSSGAAMGIYPLLMGSLPPIVAVVFIRKVGYSPNSQLLAGVFAGIGTTTVFYAFAPIPETLAVLYTLVLLQVFVSYLENYSSKSNLTVSGIFLLGITFTHKLPLLFLTVVFSIVSVSIAYGKIRPQIFTRISKYQEFEYKFTSALIFCATIGLALVVNRVGGQFFVAIIFAIVSIAWLGRVREPSWASAPKKYGLTYILLSAFLFSILFMYITPRFFEASIYNIVILLIERSGGPISSISIIEQSTFVSKPMPPWIISIFFERPALVHVFALILLPISMIGSFHLHRNKPESAATHVIVGMTFGTILFLGLGLLSSKSISYLRFVMLSEVILLVSASSICGCLLDDVEFLDGKLTNNLRQGKGIFGLLLVTILIIGLLSSGIAAPDARQGHTFYVTEEEMTAKHWGYQYISSDIRTDTYYALITFPFVNERNSISYVQFEPLDIVQGKLQQRDYDYIAYRSKPVLRTRYGFAKLNWDPETHLNTNNSKIYSSGTVQIYAG